MCASFRWVVPLLIVVMLIVVSGVGDVGGEARTRGCFV
jgi:hypothetical protein